MQGISRWKSMKQIPDSERYYDKVYQRMCYLIVFGPIFAKNTNLWLWRHNWWRHKIWNLNFSRMAYSITFKFWTEIRLGNKGFLLNQKNFRNFDDVSINLQFSNLVQLCWRHQNFEDFFDSKESLYQILSLFKIWSLNKPFSRNSNSNFYDVINYNRKFAFFTKMGPKTIR